MKLPCPACGAMFSIEAAANDAAARRLMALLAGLPEDVGRALLPYLALFRPEKTALRWSRALALAEEIAPAIKAGRVTRHGTTYAVPRETWVAGMQYLADRPQGLRLPLKSHGYLLEVLTNQAEKAAARAERQREDERKHRPGADDGPRPVGDTNYEELLKKSREIGAKQLGIEGGES
jgi:hypothetical protein